MTNTDPITGCASPDVAATLHIHVFHVVSDGEHGHPQTLVFYVVLLGLRMVRPEWNQALLEVMLTLFPREKKN